MKINKIIFLTDWSTQIGSGHYHRCNRLALAFQRIGFKTEIILESSKCDVENEIKKINWLNGEITFNKNDLIIIDSYFITTEFLEHLKQKHKVLVIDDNKLLDYRNTSILNPNLHAEILQYDQSNELLIGPNYCLANLIPNKEERNFDSIKNILITFGGTDPTNKTIEVLNSIINCNVNINVVIGLNFDSKQVKLIKEIASKYNRIHIYENLNQKTLYEKICNSDIVISATGQTTYEIISAKTPGFFYMVAENQKLSYKFLQDNELDLGKNFDLYQVNQIDSNELLKTSIKYDKIGKNFRNIDEIAKDIIKRIK